MIDINTNRFRYTAGLRPVIGSVFAPTGFPDIGAAQFARFVDGSDDTVDSLIVESIQSMANRLEATAWDAGTSQPVELLAGLPYVRVHAADPPEKFLTSSRLEAHRLASPFVYAATLDGHKMQVVLGERLGLAKDTPLDRHMMARALMTIDPFCLLHGVFFSRKEWLGQPRFPRAVTGVIEAYDVRRAVSGGRKADHVRHQLGEKSDGGGGGTAEGYGSVPFHRVDWTAREIRAMFSVDVELLRSYGLSADLTELLTAIALWEITTFLSGGMRLRSNCDLEIAEAPKELPDADALATRITELIDTNREHLGTGPLTVAWKG